MQQAAGVAGALPPDTGASQQMAPLTANSPGQSASIDTPDFVTVLAQLLESGPTVNPATLQSLITELMAEQGASGSTAIGQGSTTDTVTAAQWLASQLMQSLPEPGAGLANLGTDDTNTLMSDTNLYGTISPLVGTQQSVLPSAGVTTTAQSDKTGPSPSTQTNGTSSTGLEADITTAIRAAAAKYGVPESLIQGVVQQESGRNPQSVSPAGAMGLMQLMPATAQALGVTDPFDPAQNVDGGTRYLAGLLKDFGGDESLALAAYNAGPNAVHSYGGVPPYPETQNYVRNVLALSDQYSHVG